MKRTSTLSAFLMLLFGYCGFAQTTLKSDAIPAFNDRYYTYYLASGHNTYNLRVADAEGEKWDISDMFDGNAVTNQVDFTMPGNTTHGNEFQNADMARVYAGYEGAVYFNAESNALVKVGYTRGVFSDTVHSTYPMTYTEPLTVFETPLAYQDSQYFTGEYYGVRNLNDIFIDTIYGTVTRTVVADGYGTIKLHNDLEIDVLRIKTIEKFRDSMISRSGNVSFEQGREIRYEFRSADQGIPIVSALIRADTIAQIEWLNVEKDSGFEGLLPSSEKRFQVYPNPAVNQVKFPEETARVRIYNVHGQLCKTEAITHKAAIQMEELPEGQYFAQLFDQEGQMLGIAKWIIMR